MGRLLEVGPREREGFLERGKEERVDLIRRDREREGERKGTE